MDSHHVPLKIDTELGIQPYSIFQDLLSAPASLTIGQALFFKEVHQELAQGIKPMRIEHQEQVSEVTTALQPPHLPKSRLLFLVMSSMPLPTWVLHH